jgi:hypothetical protein
VLLPVAELTSGGFEKASALSESCAAPGPEGAIGGSEGGFDLLRAVLRVFAEERFVRGINRFEGHVCLDCVAGRIQDRTEGAASPEREMPSRDDCHSFLSPLGDLQQTACNDGISAARS